MLVIIESLVEDVNYSIYIWFFYAIWIFYNVVVGFREKELRIKNRCFKKLEGKDFRLFKVMFGSGIVLFLLRFIGESS